MNLDYLKENYSHIIELIKADWSNGDCEISEDDILNKRHLTDSNSKKKAD